MVINLFGILSISAEEIDLPAGVESLPKTSQESSKATGPLVADKQEPTELVADAEKPAAKDKDEKKRGLFGRPRASSNAKQKEKEKRKSSKGKVPTEMAGSWADAETASTRSALETADLGKSSKQSKACECMYMWVRPHVLECTCECECMCE